MLHIASEHAVERVGGLVNQSFWVVRVGVKVFKRQVAVVTDSVKRLDDARPVGRAVEQRPERLQRVIRSILREFLKVDKVIIPIYALDRSHVL